MWASNAAGVAGGVDSTAQSTFACNAAVTTSNWASKQVDGTLRFRLPVQLGGDTLVDGAIIPTTDNTFDLGTASARFRSLYVSGSTIHLGNQALSCSDLDNTLNIVNTLTNAPAKLLVSELKVGSSSNYAVVIRANPVTNQLLVVSTSNAIESSVSVVSSNEMATVASNLDAGIKVGSNTAGWASNLAVYGSNAMFLKSGGQITGWLGVGGRSPQSMLDVYSASPSQNIHMTIECHPSRESAIALKKNDETQWLIEMMGSGYGANAGNLRVVWSSNTQFNTALMLSSNGFVGINTTNPGFTLDVNGSLQASNIQVGAATGRWGMMTSPGQMRFHGNTGGCNSHHHMMFDLGSVSACPGDFIFGSFAGSNERLRIKGPTGYVGIGKSNPAVELDVQGGAAFTGQVTCSNLRSSNLAIAGPLDVAGTAFVRSNVQFADILQNRKLVLWNGINNNDHQFFGFGISPGTLRYQVETTASDHIWYAGTSSNSSSELMRLTGTGNLSCSNCLASNVTVANVAAGNFRGVLIDNLNGN